jgi:hypothetical protein
VPLNNDENGTFIIVGLIVTLVHSMKEGMFTAAPVIHRDVRSSTRNIQSCMCNLCN